MGGGALAGRVTQSPTRQAPAPQLPSLLRAMPNRSPRRASRPGLDSPRALGSGHASKRPTPPPIEKTPVSLGAVWSSSRTTGWLVQARKHV